MLLVRSALDSQEQFNLTPSVICELNGLAIEDLEEEAGVYRTGPVFIENSPHTPPPWEELPGFVDEMCAYVNENWPSATPLHLAAYLLWRVNWIHPFVEGNGRTARITSYLVLCIRLGYQLPGTLTIPEQISKDRQPYYSALDSADAAYKSGKINVTIMEDLVSRLLAEQLVAVHEAAAEPSP